MDEIRAAVCAIAELGEGEMAAAEIDGVPVLVCHVEGQFYATVNRCTHARQLLSEGRLRGFEITCPLHGARFDVRNGACLSPPASRPVPTLPVELEGGKVYVTVTEDAKPQRPKYGPMV